MDSALQAPLLAAVAALAAGFGGLCLGSAWLRRHEVERRRRRHRTSGVVSEYSGIETAPAGRVMGYAVSLSRRLNLGVVTPLVRRTWLLRATPWFDAHAKRAGVADVVSARGFVEASVRLAGIGWAIGTLVGVVFSLELAALGGVLGAAGGLTAPRRVVKHAERFRVEALERDLSEMLEVVSLGLRSGLSFDRSFELYGVHFTSVFARECEAAQRRWRCGLALREDALRDLAASYDSLLLTRVVEGIIRSLRFGSSLAEVLESAAAEARSERRMHVEEKVAKAPVKMMVPTGALILPAMLLLVLGPVLLELMEGF